MKILEITFSLLLISVTCFGFKPFKSSELKKSPEEISKLVTNDLLSRPEFMMYKAQDVKVVHYAEACVKAWNALAGYIGNNGKVSEVCAGTGQSTDMNFYLSRPRITGDLHGQAPILWFAYSLIANYR